MACTLQIWCGLLAGQNVKSGGKSNLSVKPDTSFLSDCEHGYFLPGEISEVRRFIRSMSRRSREIAAISRAAEDTLAKLIGQERVRGRVDER